VAARGVVYVHSCPPALRPHVEWAIADVLGVPARLAWTPQPAAPGTLRGESGWRGRPGTAGKIVAALRGWSPLRLEVTEEPSDGNDGERYALTPNLGLFRATMSANGDVLVQEDRLRLLAETCSDLETWRHNLDRLLGRAWDEELEVFRHAGDGQPNRWLTQVV
jgi:hypothetical protein